jgi:imidazolonepropionase-like amidohydrolase
VKVFTIAFAAFFSFLVSADSTLGQAANRTWITDVTIVSPENLDQIGTGSVLVENGRIVRIERKAGPKKPAGVTVVSGKGLFLIPGLIDSHVHLASVPGISLEASFGLRASRP